MTKLKRPERYVQFESIKPELKEITEFYTRKTADYQYKIKQLNEYADALENEISVLKETPKVEVLLDDMAKPLVVVPRFVADFIKERKESLKLYGAFHEIDENYGTGTELYDLVFASVDSQELFARAWLDGYTVDKEQLYYLKNRVTNKYLMEHKVNFRFGEDESTEESACWKTKFNQSEIDKLNIGSYEQIPVEMSDNGI